MIIISNDKKFYMEDIPGGIGLYWFSHLTCDEILDLQDVGMSYKSLKELSSALDENPIQFKMPDKDMFITGKTDELTIRFVVPFPCSRAPEIKLNASESQLFISEIKKRV